MGPRFRGDDTEDAHLLGVAFSVPIFRHMPKYRQEDFSRQGLKILILELKPSPING
jgi:hypothetical protein